MLGTISRGKCDSRIFTDALRQNFPATGTYNLGEVGTPTRAGRSGMPSPDNDTSDGVCCCSNIPRSRRRSGTLGSSTRIGLWIGLMLIRNQSGERNVDGGITEAGDVNLRQALFQAATVMMNHGRSTWLRVWARAARKQDCYGRPGSPYRGHTLADLDKWHGFPIGNRTKSCLMK